MHKITNLLEKKTAYLQIEFRLVHLFRSVLQFYFFFQNRQIIPFNVRETIKNTWAFACAFCNNLNISQVLPTMLLTIKLKLHSYRECNRQSDRFFLSPCLPYRDGLWLIGYKFIYSYFHSFFNMKSIFIKINRLNESINQVTIFSLLFLEKHT